MKHYIIRDESVPCRSSARYFTSVQCRQIGQGRQWVELI